MIESQSPVAPRMFLRRLARHYMPWLVLAIAATLAAYAWVVGAPLKLALGWFLLVFVATALFDVSKQHSRLIWLYYVTLGRHSRSVFLKESKEESQVLADYPMNRLTTYEQRFNLYCPLAILLAFWLLAVALSFLFFAPNLLGAWLQPTGQPRLESFFPQLSDPVILEREKTALIVLLLTVSSAPYAWAVASLKTLRTPYERALLWIAIPLMGIGAGSLALWPSLRSWPTVSLADATFFLFFLYIFAYQRLWVGDRVVNRLLEQLSQDIRSSPALDLMNVTELIRKTLNYDRVFILMAAENRETLTVKGEAGDYPSVLGSTIPLASTQGLTVRAFQTREAVAWNDVRHGKCSYYRRLVDERLDDTCGEIAIPIIYRGTVFGVLDVQSKRPGAFGNRDVANLETIGRVLGAAYAEDRVDHFFSALAELSDQLIQYDAPTDEALVSMSFDFANQLVGADSLFFCRLSPSGFPLTLTKIRPESSPNEQVDVSCERPVDPLIKLLAEWRPAFWTNGQDCILSSDGVVAGALEGAGHSIASLCFWPVGTPRDPLGALILTFTHPNEFDSLRKLALLTLVQLLTSILSRKRYQEIMFRSYGRAELLVHNLVGRHGFKDGVVQRAAALSWAEEVVHCSSFDDCYLSTILSGVDSFLSELQLAEGYAPPNFWHHDLLDSIHKYISSLPPGRNGRRPDVTLDVYPEIEREKPWVKLALYRLVVEAIENAIFHGKPGRLQLKLQREPLAIAGYIVNDGLELPQGAEGRRSSRGIYFLRDELEKQFLASVVIEKRNDERGAIVSFAIPAMPMASHIGELL